jgi:hypothetical protein
LIHFVGAGLAGDFPVSRHSASENPFAGKAGSHKSVNFYSLI